MDKRITTVPVSWCFIISKGAHDCFIDCDWQFFKTTEVFLSSYCRHQHRNYKKNLFPLADKGISKRWCFKTPSHIPYVFVVRLVNKIHIVIPTLSKESSGILLLTLFCTSVRPSERIVCHWNSVYISNHHRLSLCNQCLNGF